MEIKGVDGITWTADMLETLGCNLLECCPHVREACEKYNNGEEGDVMLSYQVEQKRYSALIRLSKGHYYECNFWLDFGGGTPYPCEVEQYKLYCADFICGIDRQLNFIGA